MGCVIVAATAHRGLFGLVRILVIKPANDSEKHVVRSNIMLPFLSPARFTNRGEPPKTWTSAR
jgi:hypothetical protein